MSGWFGCLRYGTRIFTCKTRFLSEDSILSKLVIRPATKDDYKAVMGVIPNLYDGQDYIPAKYHQMIQDPKRFHFVAELNKEIVGYRMFFIVDDNKTFIRQAARVKPEYHGMGISYSILQYAIPAMKSYYPSLETVSYTTHLPSMRDSALSDKKLLHFDKRNVAQIQLESTDYLRKAVACSKFQLLLENLPMKDDTHQLPSSKAIVLLDSLATNKQILSEHAWVVGYEPFKPLHENHVTITQMNSAGTAQIMVTKNYMDDIVALSFGVLTPLEAGVLWKLDYYANLETQRNVNGQLLLNTHILKHLTLLSQVKNHGNVIIDVSIPTAMPQDMVGECLRSAGITCSVDMNTWETYIIERWIT